MRRPDPRDLYELVGDRPELGEPVLVQALDGFIDAGSATRLTRAHLMSALGSTVVARFDVDQLHDYRARRPPMQFDGDHWASYADPELVVHLLQDEGGGSFLLLTGPEPDVQWERFTEAVRLLVVQLGVRLTVGLNAIPMALPHTRPVGVIAHGNRKDLIAAYEPWVGSVSVPASAGHLLEHRLIQAGHDAIGFAVNVPHYVSQSEFPAASVALLREVGTTTGLLLPTLALEEAAATTRQAIDAQIAENDEVAGVVRALEDQYDSFVKGRENSVLATEQDLPSADELGAELERFLIQQSRDQ